MEFSKENFCPETTEYWEYKDMQFVKDREATIGTPIKTSIGHIWKWAVNEAFESGKTGKAVSAYSHAMVNSYGWSAKWVGNK